MGAGGAGGPSGGALSDATTAKRLTALRHKVLRDEDFVESEEVNRDPYAAGWMGSLFIITTIRGLFGAARARVIIG